MILKTYEKHKCTSEHESDDDDSVIDDSYDEAPSSPMDAAENIDHTTDEVNVSINYISLHLHVGIFVRLLREERRACIQFCIL